MVDAAAAVYWASDTTTDTTPRDAARRAVEWLTPLYAASIEADLPGNPGADWLTLAEHQGRYAVAVADATAAMPDLPKDTTITASRGRILTLTPTGPGGWTADAQTLVVRFDLTRSSGAAPWLINSISVSQVTTDPDTMLDFG